MRFFSFIIILLIIILGATFAVLNATPVTFYYYVGAKQLPLSLLLVISFCIGIIICFLAMSYVVVRLKAQRRYCEKKLRLAEQEINNLRAIPIKD